MISAGGPGSAPPHVPDRQGVGDPAGGIAVEHPGTRGEGGGACRGMSDLYTTRYMLTDAPMAARRLRPDRNVLSPRPRLSSPGERPGPDDPRATKPRAGPVVPPGAVPNDGVMRSAMSVRVENEREQATGGQDRRHGRACPGGGVARRSDGQQVAPARPCAADTACRPRRSAAPPLPRSARRSAARRRTPGRLDGISRRDSSVYVWYILTCLLSGSPSQTSPEALADLRARLRATRWPDAPEDAGWSLGTDLDYLRELVAYWADGFDWPAQEAALNRLPALPRAARRPRHPLRARPGRRPGPPVLPLVLSHGWPDSFWRYTKVIPLLTDPGATAATRPTRSTWSCRTCPGFGYSDRPAGPPLDSIAVAGLWAELMTRARLPAVRRRRRRHRQRREPLPRARTTPNGSWPSTAWTRACRSTRATRPT